MLEIKLSYHISYLILYYYLLNFIALFLLCCFNVGYRQYQSLALINYLSIYNDSMIKTTTNNSIFELGTCCIKIYYYL